MRRQKGALQRAVTEENWEGLLDQFGHSPERSATAAPAERDETPLVSGESHDYAAAAIVIYVGSGRCRVFHEGVELDCVVPPEIAVRQKSLLAVGDRVTLESDGSVNRIAAVLPRHTVLARPDPINHHRQRLIAANIDLVVHVVSVKAPPLRLRLIDRVLIAVHRGGAGALIAVNKIELLDPAARSAELERLSVFADLGVHVVACSAQTGEGIDSLRAHVQGRTAALVGHSGVGKSSILNALDSRLQLATRTLHSRGTGRHTTSSSTLYDFGDGTYLMDTPGIREFGLWALDRDSLRDYFPEFDEASEYCRFTDCSHVHEPDCEVKRRVEAGSLDHARYDAYLRLYEEVGETTS